MKTTLVWFVGLIVTVFISSASAGTNTFNSSVMSHQTNAPTPSGIVASSDPVVRFALDEKVQESWVERFMEKSNFESFTIGVGSSRGGSDMFTFPPVKQFQFGPYQGDVRFRIESRYPVGDGLSGEPQAFIGFITLEFRRAR